MAQFKFPADMVGYSLIRFSSVPQADGDTFRRQVMAAEGFAREEGVALDKSLHETDIRKLAITGFTGKHVVKGPLRKFLAGIENGSVKPGKSLLLVSEWNRLTRQVSSDAVKLVIDLMERGIGIVDLQDRTYYTLDRYNADVGLQVGLQIKISMAHQYSKNLSHNLAAAWEGRRQAVMAGEAKANNNCPEWIEAIDGEYHLTAKHLHAIERIKELRYLGLGGQAIATRLNREGFLAFRGERGWHGSSVRHVVRSIALMGLYQPVKGRKEKIGEPVKLYPAVMTPEEWWRMQWPKNGPKAARGRKSAKVKNLLQGVVHCQECADAGRRGGVLVYEDKGRNRTRLICDNARRGRCGNRTGHNYATLEKEVLTALALLDFSRLIDKSNPEVARIAGLEAEIAEKTATLEKMAEGFGANVPAAFFKRAQTLQAEIDAAKTRLVEARHAARIAEANAGQDCYAMFKALVAALPGLQGDELEKTRTRIQTELRRIIEAGRAEGDGMRIELVSAPFHKVTILIEKSEITSFRLASYMTNGIPTETNIIWPRDVLLSGDGVPADMAGLFGQFVGQEAA